MGCWGWDVRSGVLGWGGSGWMLRGCVGGGNLGVESRVCDVSGWVLGVGRYGWGVGGGAAGIFLQR